MGWGNLCASVFFAVILTSCKLPDLTGFSASAISMRTSLDQAESIYRPFVEQHKPDSIKKFDEDWKKIEVAADSLVKYAQSLEAITAAGEKGAEGAQQLAKSVDELASKFDATALAGSVGADIFAEVYGAAVTSIAANTLAETTAKAQPLIDRICADLADKVFDNLAGDIPTLYSGQKRKIDMEYADVAGLYEILINKRAGYIKPLAAKAPDEWTEDEQAKLEMLDELLVRMQPRHAEWKQAIKNAEKLSDNQQQLLKQLGTTVRAFAAEHRSIQAAVEANRTFSLSNVQYAAGELDRLVQRIEEIQDDR